MFLPYFYPSFVYSPCKLSHPLERRMIKGIESVEDSTILYVVEGKDTKIDLLFSLPFPLILLPLYPTFKQLHPKKWRLPWGGKSARGKNNSLWKSFFSSSRENTPRIFFCFLLFDLGLYPISKSYIHSKGENCRGGGKSVRGKKERSNIIFISVVRRRRHTKTASSLFHFLPSSRLPPPLSRTSKHLLLLTWRLKQGRKDAREAEEERK